VQVFAQAFWVPKAGSSDTEYEDAFWPDKRLHGQDTCFRFAVADVGREPPFLGFERPEAIRRMRTDRLMRPRVGLQRVR
jgi:hypothetical protein